MYCWCLAVQRIIYGNRDEIPCGPRRSLFIQKPWMKRGVSCYVQNVVFSQCAMWSLWSVWNVLCVCVSTERAECAMCCSLKGGKRVKSLNDARAHHAGSPPRCRGDTDASLINRRQRCHDTCCAVVAQDDVRALCSHPRADRVNALPGLAGEREMRRSPGDTGVQSLVCRECRKSSAHASHPERHTPTPSGGCVGAPIIQALSGRRTKTCKA